MTDRKPLFRIALDSGMLIALLGLAFWTGGLNQRVAAMQVPGGVPISIEARERLSALETHWKSLDSRLDRIERKLDSLSNSNKAFQ